MGIDYCKSMLCERGLHLLFMTVQYMYVTQIEELPSPFGDCEQSQDYVESNCLADCRANYVIGKCNCKEMYMPGDKK